VTICDVLIDEYRPEDRRDIMDYVCGQCGMGVTGMKCVKCGQELVHDHITTDEGATVAVSKCPDGCGMIKSPLCCGVDMTCST
jgi:DNA-directed RNA polymerase subunit RPC12/RpoP